MTELTDACTSGHATESLRPGFHERPSRDHGSGVKDARASQRLAARGGHGHRASTTNGCGGRVLLAEGEVREAAEAALRRPWLPA
jgi:hypothetical protein